MVKGKVKTNKANDTKYIYLSKDCGFIDGQEVDIVNSGIGIYQKEKLEKYLKEHREMFIEIKKRMKTIRKNIWDSFFEMGNIIGKAMDYGKLEWDEALYFEKNNEYSTSPNGDTEGGEFCNLRPEQLKRQIKERKLNQEKVKKELTDYIFMDFLQRKSEELIEQQYKEEVEMMKEFGFENKQDVNYLDYGTTLYSNGLVQLHYDAGSFVYNETFNVTTMRQVDIGSDEPSIEI